MRYTHRFLSYSPYTAINTPFPSSSSVTSVKELLLMRYKIPLLFSSSKYIHPLSSKSCLASSALFFASSAYFCDSSALLKESSLYFLESSEYVWEDVAHSHDFFELSKAKSAFFSAFSA